MLRYGTTKSCGCIRRKSTAKNFTKHHFSGSRMYNIWKGMKRRCRNKNDSCYKFYGAKGVDYCEEWDRFENFYADMSDGYKDNLTIDRIDPRGNYCKENCRWLTLREQAYNKRDTIYVTYKGKKMNLHECSELTGLKTSILSYRHRKGWSDKEIIETPYGEGRNE